MKRQEYLLSEEDHAALMNASQPVPAMFLSGGRPMYEDPRAKAEREWQRIGDDMGFKWRTVEPVPRKSNRYFSAEPK